MLTSTRNGEIRTISECPTCENRLFQKRFTKKGRDFWRCQSCGLEKQFPLPTVEELKEYYDESYSTGMYKDFTDASDIKYLTAKHRLKNVIPYCQPGRLLDIGCSNGSFIAHAKESGLHAEGIDLSAVAIREAQERGLTAFCTTAEEFDPGYRYETITFFDVLEHVLDPFGFLQSVHRLLAPGGMVALTVPNHGSLIRKLMGHRWYFYIPEEHLHYFNPSTISALLGRAGFEVKRCSWTYKPLTYRYSLVQFQEYNPLIFKMLSAGSAILPQRLADASVPLYIGEMMVIARRRE